MGRYFVESVGVDCLAPYHAGGGHRREQPCYLCNCRMSCKVPGKCSLCALLSFHSNVICDAVYKRFMIAFEDASCVLNFISISHTLLFC